MSDNPSQSSSSNRNRPPSDNTRNRNKRRVSSRDTSQRAPKIKKKLSIQQGPHSEFDTLSNITEEDSTDSTMSSSENPGTGTSTSESVPGGNEPMNTDESSQNTPPVTEQSTSTASTSTTSGPQTVFMTQEQVSGLVSKVNDQQNNKRHLDTTSDLRSETGNETIKKAMKEYKPGKIFFYNFGAVSTNPTYSDTTKSTKSHCGQFPVTMPEVKLGDVYFAAGIRPDHLSAFIDTDPKRIPVSMYDHMVQQANNKEKKLIPAFPVCFSSIHPSYGEYTFVYFCCVGSYYVLEKMLNRDVPAFTVNPIMAERVAVLSMLAYSMPDDNKMNIRVLKDATYADLTTNYGPFITFTEEYWNSCNYATRFVICGELETRSHHTGSQSIGTTTTYALCRFIFTMMRKVPNERASKLITTLSGGKIQFRFTDAELESWTDMFALGEDRLEIIMGNLMNHVKNMNSVLTIILDRLRTYGLTSLNVILEAMDQFPNIPWTGVVSQWFPGQVENVFRAVQVFSKEDFPVLKPNLFKEHGVTKYRKLACFAAHLIKQTGVNPNIGNHKGLSPVGLPHEAREMVNRVCVGGIPKSIGLSADMVRAIHQMKRIEISPEEVQALVARSQKLVEEQDRMIAEMDRRTILEKARQYEMAIERQPSDQV